MPQKNKEGSGLWKSYGYLFTIILVIAILYGVTQNPTVNPRDPAASNHDATIYFNIQDGYWDNNLRLVKTPYDCRHLYSDGAVNLVNRNDIVLTVNPSDDEFTLNDIGKGGNYRFCSKTDYGGVIESTKFRVLRVNNTAYLQEPDGNTLTEPLSMKEYYEGDLRQFRDFRLRLLSVELKPI